MGPFGCGVDDQDCVALSQLDPVEERLEHFRVALLANLAVLIADSWKLVGSVLIIHLREGVWIRALNNVHVFGFQLRCGPSEV